MKRLLPCFLLMAALIRPALGGAGYAEKTERFDRDPGWEGVNNRPTSPLRPIKQDFGYSAASHFGKAGELGGFITPDGSPAYYAKKIATKTFEDPLTASGKLVSSNQAYHVLVGFFNSGTLNEWRTPNTVALRISGRGDFFYAWLEYATNRWRAGGDSPQGFATRDPVTGRSSQLEFPTVNGRVHQWSLRYDPAANGGLGAVFAQIDDKMAVCNLDAGHKADGATFNRFGLLNIIKSADGGGEFWLDDVNINGETESFERDPKWEGRGNRRTYETAEVRPRFDFGFSPTTRFAGGQAAGELGGLVYRGDGRYPDKMAWYTDRIPAALSPSKTLKAGGRIVLSKGVSDSTTILGFFNSKTSTAIDPSQDTGLPYDFFGVAVEGPSSEGFLLYPTYRLLGNSRQNARASTPNRILPDGKSHTWSLGYDPKAGKAGRLTVRLDEGTVTLDMEPGDREAPVRFDRFGILTTRVDGNGQRVHFDDLTYTIRQ